MKKKVLISVLINGGIVLGLGFFLSGVLAYTIEKFPNLSIEGSFAVSPTQNEAFLKPGETIVRNLNITSRLGKRMQFRVTTEDFTGTKTGETAAMLLGEERGPYSLKDYLKPELTEFTLDQGERMVLPIEVSIPLDAEPGGRYGAVLVAAIPPPPEIEPDPGEAGAAIRAIARIASLYLVRVEGELVEDGYLKEIRMADGKDFYEKGPFSFSLAFENKGNVHLTPYGIIEIKNILGKKIEEIEIEPWFAMPESLRLRIIKWDRKLAFGRYTAVAKINRGYKDIIDERSIVFWVLPYRVVLPIFLGIIALVIFFRLLASKFEIRIRKKI